MTGTEIEIGIGTDVTDALLPAITETATDDTAPRRPVVDPPAARQDAGTAPRHHEGG